MTSPQKDTHGETFQGKIIPDWKLPRGVARTQWDYITNEFVANHYDRSLAGSLLFEQDFSYFCSNCPTPGLTLDLGCGTGRLAAGLSILGYTTLNIDLSQNMLAIGRTKTLDSTNALFVRANMVELPFIRGCSLDYAACLFSSFGMILNPIHRKEMLMEVHRVLKTGGSLILHVHNLWSSIQRLKDLWWMLPDLWKRLGNHSDYGNKLMPTHQEIHGLTLHLFTLNEIKSLLAGIGFVVRNVTPLFSSNSVPGAKFLFWGPRPHGYLLHAEKPGRAFLNAQGQ